MPDITPPPLPTASPNAGLAKLPDDKDTTAKIARINAYVTRIRNAVAAIDVSSQTHTATRAIIGVYYPLINPKLARFGQQQFPKTVRHHARSKDRSTEYSKPALLFFSIGNAILSLYQYALDGHKPDPTPLERHIKLLEDIARLGMAAFVLKGDENEGFWLEQGS